MLFFLSENCPLSVKYEPKVRLGEQRLLPFMRAKVKIILAENIIEQWIISTTMSDNLTWIKQLEIDYQVQLERFNACALKIRWPHALSYRALKCRVFLAMCYSQRVLTLSSVAKCVACCKKPWEEYQMPWVLKHSGTDRKKELFLKVKTAGLMRCVRSYLRYEDC